MFLEFDGYFVNLAKVDDITPASEHPDEDRWDLFVELDDPESVPIPLRSGFLSLEHAETFRRALIRHACTTGLSTDEDMDRIFLETMPTDRPDPGR
ncbi:hypothetical protein ACFQ36_05965 [Arthrobacter sp. GCM10027362]|uniref:hypothetical protein n=1 Tax=Arthrobacter sp. GCM10027362 TaxID=3273379 RepID=UPI00363D97AF